jgi:uncharacterized membrane protein YdbT with pleckstrin-like domain
LRQRRQLSSQPDTASEVIWQGHPWLTPALAGLTIGAIALALVLSWVEFATRIAFKAVGPVPLLVATYGLVFLLWIVGSFRLALIRASSHYVLRGSSLEIQHGILSRRIFTVSAAGFSDLQVIKSVWGRILNTGTIVVETDSDRDLKMSMVHDPINVSMKIRQVMTVPVVRVSSQEPVPVKNGKT